jgi:hypothetical protein
MGGLAIARIPYVRYLKWVAPLLGILTVVIMVADLKPGCHRSSKATWSTAKIKKQGCGFLSSGAQAV